MISLHTVSSCGCVQWKLFFFIICFLSKCASISLVAVTILWALFVENLLRTVTSLNIYLWSVIKWSIALRVWPSRVFHDQFFVFIYKRSCSADKSYFLEEMSKAFPPLSFLSGLQKIPINISDATNLVPIFALRSPPMALITTS